MCQQQLRNHHHGLYKYTLRHVDLRTSTGQDIANADAGKAKGWNLYNFRLWVPVSNSLTPAVRKLAKMAAVPASPPLPV